MHLASRYPGDWYRTREATGTYQYRPGGQCQCIENETEHVSYSPVYAVAVAVAAREWVGMDFRSGAVGGG